MKRRTFFVFLSVFVQVIALHGVSTGGYPAAFLQIPVYPRPLAMGGAFAALADGPAAVFWNPAGLSEMENSSISISYSRLTLDRAHNFATIALPFGSSYNCFAIGIDNLLVRNIDKRDATGTRVGTFNDSESAVFMAIASSFFASENIIVDIGINTKFIMHTFDDADAKGFSLDIGMISDFQRTLRLALVLHDSFGKLWWNTGTTENIPQRLKAGLAITIRSIPLAIEADMSYNIKSDAMTVFAGAELTLLRVLSIRGGYNTRTNTPSFGLGIHASRNFAIDYAYTQDQLETRPSHHIGLTISF